MNARVRAPRFTNDALCWKLLQLPPGARVKDLAQALDWSEPVTSQRLSQLKHLGLVEHGRGSTKLTPRGMAHARAAANIPDDVLQLHLSPPCPALEPRGSNQLPPMPLMIEALALQQDALLARANELLQRRVRELEAEVADLKDQRSKALQRLGFVCDALTG